MLLAVSLQHEEGRVEWIILIGVMFRMKWYVYLGELSCICVLEGTNLHLFLRSCYCCCMFSLLRGKEWAHTTRIILQPFIEVSVSIQESEWSCICVFGVSFLIYFYDLSIELIVLLKILTVCVGIALNAATTAVRCLFHSGPFTFNKLHSSG